MMQSMTGFGKASSDLKNKKYSVELKSLNNKQTDIQIRIPQNYREKEMYIRKLIISKLLRGKIELSIRLDGNTTGAASTINPDTFAKYYTQLRALSKEQKIDLQDDTVFESIMRLPDILKTEESELDETEWIALSKAIDQALEQLLAFRKQEGKALETDILKRIAKIRHFAEQVPQYEAERIEKIRERINSNLNELKSKEGIDKNRFEQEIIYYLEKLDITEEKVRLANHLNYFEKTSQEQAPLGKKLSFISQEIGREINTLGSKASHYEIQKLVVQMKDELEKIKEQLMNVL